MAIMIEPKNINSIRSAERIVKILRNNELVRRNSIIRIEVNGFDEYLVIVLSSVEDEVCCILNSEQDEYNFYSPNWSV